MFTSTFLGKNPLTRQTRRTFNRSRANLNGPIRNTFIVFCWNQSETILLQGSPELLISLLYMRRRALSPDWCLLLLTLNYQWILVEWSLYFQNSPKKLLSVESLGSKTFFPQVERWGTHIHYEHEQWYLQFLYIHDRMSEIFWHLVTAASRTPRFKTTWPRNDGLWGREWVFGVL